MFLNHNNMIKDFAISTPESEGVSSRNIYNFLTEINKKLELHSFILCKNNKVISSSWWKPYSSEKLHMLWSVSKSFTSTAVGFAVDEKLLSINDKVISFFPDELPGKISRNLEQMSVFNLLTMTTGHESEPFQRNQEYDWVKSYLKVPVKYKPGTRFLYSSLASYMLSAILQKLTGQTLHDYLTPRLFKPLNIEETSWLTCPKGINTGGWGLKARTESIAKLGSVYLNNGVWNGKRIISEKWVQMASSKQTSNGKNPDSDWEQGYGFQFWRCRHNCFRADGAGGQFCIIMPEQNAVLAITSAVQDMQLLLNLVWKYLLPTLNGLEKIDDKKYQTRLKEKIQKLSILCPSGENKTENSEILNKKYSFAENILNIRNFEFINQNTIVFETHLNEVLPIEFGYSKWINDNNKFLIFNAINNSVEDVFAAGAWKNNTTFELKFTSTQSATETLIFKFKKDEVSLCVISPFLLKQTLKGYCRNN